MTLFVHHYDAEKDEIIFREMTKEELTQYEKDQKESLDKIEARKSALAKLAALGLTEDEIAAL